jgi:hypothetical protein
VEYLEALKKSENGVKKGRRVDVLSVVRKVFFQLFPELTERGEKFKHPCVEAGVESLISSHQHTYQHILIPTFSNSPVKLLQKSGW